MATHSKISKKASTTLTVRMPTSTKSKLETLAARTDRSKSYLANDAIERYLERELEIVEGIEKGLADMDAGRVVHHDEAMRRIRAADQQDTDLSDFMDKVAADLDDWT